MATSRVLLVLDAGPPLESSEAAKPVRSCVRDLRIHRDLGLRRRQRWIHYLVAIEWGIDLTLRYALARHIRHGIIDGGDGWEIPYKMASPSTSEYFVCIAGASRN